MGDTSDGTAASAAAGAGDGAVPAAAEISWRAWVVQHWRGELSLGDAFWTNGVVLNLAFGFVVWGLNRLPADNSTWPWKLMNVALAAFFFAMTLWQVVGVWRSARHFPGRRLDDGRYVGRWLWSIVARLVVICWASHVLGLFGLFVYMLVDTFM